MRARVGLKLERQEDGRHRKLEQKFYDAGMGTIHREDSGVWFEDILIADSAVDAHREIEHTVRDAGWEPDPRDRLATRLPDGRYSVRVLASHAKLVACGFVEIGDVSGLRHRT